MTVALVDLPTEAQMEAPGCKPVVFKSSDMIHLKYWRRLLDGVTNLGQYAFADELQFKKYFYLTSGLLEGTVIVHGKERSGKSCWCNYTGYWIRELFGKGTTFINTRPKKGKMPRSLRDEVKLWNSVTKQQETHTVYSILVKEGLEVNKSIPVLLEELRDKIKARYIGGDYSGVSPLANELLKTLDGYGNFDYLNDQMLVEELDLLKQLTNMQNDLAEDDDIMPDIQDKLKQSRLYNRVIFLDEAHQHMEGSRITNRVRAYSRLLPQYGHIHSLIILATQNERILPQELIYERRTHDVGCSFDIRKQKCSYTIFWKRQGISKSQEITPAKWSHIWDTHNLVAGGDTLKIKL